MNHPSDSSLPSREERRARLRGRLVAGAFTALFAVELGAAGVASANAGPTAAPATGEGATPLAARVDDVRAALAARVAPADSPEAAPAWGNGWLNWRNAWHNWKNVWNNWNNWTNWQNWANWSNY